MSKINISEEEREKRRQRAIELHAKKREDGRPVFGGPQPGSGRPRKKRASEVVAERVAEEGDAIAAAIIENLADDKPATVRLQAAKTALDFEAQEEKRKREEGDLRGKTNDELIDLIARGASELYQQGRLDAAITDGMVLDGEAEEIK